MTEPADVVPAEPLARPDPELIQRLFDEDPLNLSDQDYDLIIAEFRAQRMEYMQPEAEKPKKASASRAKKPAVELGEDAQDLLKDLGLDIS